MNCNATEKDDVDERPGPLEPHTPCLRNCVQAALELYFRDLNGHKPGDLYRMVISEVEQPLLEIVMTHARGNQTRAAEILGLNRTTLRKKLKQYGLE